MPFAPVVHPKLISAAAVFVAQYGRFPPEHARLVPTGQTDNSPAFQRRVIVGVGMSPCGTLAIPNYSRR